MGTPAVWDRNVVSAAMARRQEAMLHVHLRKFPLPNCRAVPLHLQSAAIQISTAILTTVAMVIRHQCSATPAAWDRNVVSAAMARRQEAMLHVHLRTLPLPNCRAPALQ